MIEKLIDIVKSTGAEMYESRCYSCAKTHAQEATAGRTHYYSNGSLRFFNARVNDARVIHGGLFFMALESAQPPHGARVHRAVVHDVFGNLVHRTEDCRNVPAARIAYANWLKDFDPVAHYLDAMTDRHARMLKETNAIAIAIESAKEITS